MKEETSEKTKRKTSGSGNGKGAAKGGKKGASAGTKKSGKGGASGSVTAKPAPKTTEEKKENIRKMQEERKRKKILIDTILGLVHIALGVFFLVCVFSDAGGKFGRVISDALRGVLGLIGMAFPFYLILMGILLMTHKALHFTVRTIIVSFILLLLLSIINSGRFIGSDFSVAGKLGEFYKDGTSLDGGGLFGMVVGTFIVKWLGKPGLYIFSILAVLICLLFLLNTPLSRWLTKHQEAKEEKQLIAEMERAEKARTDAVLRAQAREERKYAASDNYSQAEGAASSVSVPASGSGQAVNPAPAFSQEPVSYPGSPSGQGSAPYTGPGTGQISSADPGCAAYPGAGVIPDPASYPGSGQVSGYAVNSVPYSGSYTEPVNGQGVSFNANSASYWPSADDAFGQGRGPAPVRSPEPVFNSDADFRTVFNQGAASCPDPGSGQGTRTSGGTGSNVMNFLKRKDLFSDNDRNGITEKGTAREVIISTEGSGNAEEAYPGGSVSQGGSDDVTEGPYTTGYGLDGLAPVPGTDGNNPETRNSGYGSGISRPSRDKAVDNGGKPRGGGSSDSAPVFEDKNGKNTGNSGYGLSGSSPSPRTGSADGSSADTGSVIPYAVMAAATAGEAAEGLNKGLAAPYSRPPVELLDPVDRKNTEGLDAVLKSQASKLEETLRSFNVDAHVIRVTRGPTATRFEIEPAPGVKVNSIVNLSNDIALNLRAKSIRIEAPIPGQAAVGIEIENDKVRTVRFREILDSKAFRQSKSKISFALGMDIAGNPIVADLRNMPHLLIAGSTGSGKSVCINSIICSILYKADPDEVRLIVIDPKVVELDVYNGIPHLLIPVVTDTAKAAGALNWAVTEMTDRYKLFAENNVRGIEGYNKLMEEQGEKIMPQIVIIIDELADLMIAARAQVEESITRLAQLARAAGMHLIVATQRPSVDVITGLIKANIPSRIAFAVSSQIDSRTIIDMAGAEKLVGKGDMLFKPLDKSKPLRVQGCFISDDEVTRITDFVKSQKTDETGSSGSEEVRNAIENTGSAQADDRPDELLPDAIAHVVKSRKASTSMIQRRFRIGYNRAARIMEQMEERNIVGPADGSRARSVLISEEEFESMRDSLI